jgi:hypothetical protein
MDKPDRFHVFTLYFQETPADEKWIEAFEKILWLADQSCKAEWRCEHEENVGQAFLKLHKSGIYIDAVEQPRVAVFIRDEVEKERPGRNGAIERYTLKSWGCGGSTGPRLKKKLVALLRQVIEAVNREVDKWEELKIDRAAAMGLLGFIETEEFEENR